MPTAPNKLDKLEQQRDKLNARIQAERARHNKQKRKERNSRLVQWGVVIEQMLKTGQLSPEKWAEECHRHLTEPRDLGRALTGELRHHEKPENNA